MQMNLCWTCILHQLFNNNKKCFPAEEKCSVSCFCQKGNQRGRLSETCTVLLLPEEIIVQQNICSLGFLNLGGWAPGDQIATWGGGAICTKGRYVPRGYMSQGAICPMGRYVRSHEALLYILRGDTSQKAICPKGNTSQEAICPQGAIHPEVWYVLGNVLGQIVP